MAYDDLNNTHNPSAGTAAPATWGDQVRDNDVWLSARPHCHVTKAAAQAISDSTETTLLFDTERRDNDTMHSTASNTGRLTATTAGFYLFWASGNFVANATGYRRILGNLNGSQLDPFGETEFAPSAGATTRVSLAFTYPMSATDYMQFTVYQTSGGNLNASFEAGAILLSL